MIGATGAAESIVCIKVINEGIVPPTINLENQDPEVANLNYVPNKAVKKAQENNRKNGIPNVYCINGKIVFELPNGEVSQPVKTPYGWHLIYDISKK